MQRQNKSPLPLFRDPSVFRPRLLQFPYRHPKTIKSDDTQRQNMVICSLCQRLNVYRPRLPQSPLANQRPSSLLARIDKLWSSAPFRRPQCPSIETIEVSPINQRQASLLACRDHHGHSLLLFSRLLQSPSLSRDNQVRWHAETIMAFIYILKTTMSSVIAFLQKEIMSSFAFRRRLCLQSLHAFKGDNDHHLHFEDDNVVSHCMPSKATMTIIYILKTIMSSVIACFQRRQ